MVTTFLIKNKHYTSRESNAGYVISKFTVLCLHPNRLKQMKYLYSKF